MIATTLQIGHTYKLVSLPREERKDGVIYLNRSRVFRLLAVDEEEAWIKCIDNDKRFVVDAWRLKNY